MHFRRADGIEEMSPPASCHAAEHSAAVLARRAHHIDISVYRLSSPSFHDVVIEYQSTAALIGMKPYSANHVFAKRQCCLMPASRRHLGELTPPAYVMRPMPRDVYALGNLDAVSFIIALKWRRRSSVVAFYYVISRH